MRLYTLPRLSEEREALIRQREACGKDLCSADAAALLFEIDALRLELEAARSVVLGPSEEVAP